MQLQVLFVILGSFVTIILVADKGVKLAVVGAIPILVHLVIQENE